MVGRVLQTCNGEAWLLDERQMEDYLRNLRNVSVPTSIHIDGEYPIRPRLLCVQTCLTNQLPLSSSDSYTAAIEICFRGDATESSL